ncbi:glycosyltransferase family 90 protein [Spirosoma sp. RP8]|uniref:Glycosyltransferase family 90 protein n=1 Tax=Spirosoma liriopis TaxID=2937440 RepID=A0ABT0HV55_9BACT|nr:glycosyltransferase family 90 protein [Spirosoma liriopis]MCK8496076.1 glycosyltransferase family 90 protein [Spirosoma liriopis]
MIEVHLDFNGRLRYYSDGGYESRDDLTINFFEDALQRMNCDISKIKVKKFYINTDDISINYNNNLTFGYTAGKNIVLCPDYIFSKWTECRIENYSDSINKILAKGLDEYTINKLFWIGNPRSQELRYKLLSLGIKNPEKMEIIGMNWIREYDKGVAHKATKFVSIEDHTIYKYLIDCGAGGYSGRLKLLLHTNRPLFLVERDIEKTEYFFRHLKEYEHFIPVKADLSDLLEKLQWADDNDDLVRDIASSARQFAINNLSREKAIEYLITQLTHFLF